MEFDGLLPKMGTVAAARGASARHVTSSSVQELYLLTATIEQGQPENILCRDECLMVGKPRPIRSSWSYRPGTQPTRVRHLQGFLGTEEEAA